MSTSNTSLVEIASTVRAKLSVNIVSTAVSSIIIAVDVVSLIITETVTNHIRNKPKNTIFKKITIAIRTYLFFRKLCALKPNSTQLTSKCMTTFKQPRQVLCCTISDFISEQNDGICNYFFKTPFTQGLQIP